MKFDGCPEGMYPLDVDYVNEEDNLGSLIVRAEATSDLLNLPLSWYLSQEEGTFEVVFFMPRKNKTFSIRTSVFHEDVAVEWVLDFTKRAATTWFGWNGTTDGNIS